ncbi:MAG: hypothetical protein ACI350_05550, partial [Prevotella sp.]
REHYISRREHYISRREHYSSRRETEIGLHTPEDYTSLFRTFQSGVPAFPSRPRPCRFSLSAPGPGMAFSGSFLAVSMIFSKFATPKQKSNRRL